MTLQDKMLEAISNESGGSATSDSAATEVACKIAEEYANQEKIAFVIEVLEDILTESDNNGLPNWQKLAIKLTELKSLQK